MNPMESRQRLKITTRGEREVVMTRTIFAPREAVFGAFTNPDMVRCWLLGPDGWSMPICEIDLRPGGSYRYVWRNDDDGSEFGVVGTYREIVAPERLVHLERFDDPSMPGELLVTTEFVERDGSTTVSMTILFDSRETRDQTLATGMANGMDLSYDRLAATLSSLSTDIH